MPTRRFSFLIIPGLILLLFNLSVFFYASISIAHARQDPPTPTPTPDATAPETPPASSSPTPNLSIADEVCLSCHGVPGEMLTLPSGEVWDLYVPPDLHQNSVHGELGYACVQCHTDVGEYPHPPFEADDLREVTLKLNDVCARCHIHQSELEQDSVHAAAQAAGVREAAVCADCHTAHEVRRLNDPETHELLPDARQWIPERCALCHNDIYQKYSESVHGSALSEGNPDVPTCINCHGVHNIEDPNTAYFRLRSPQMCAECHTDPELMAKYGLSTDVLDTYVDDFHGTTVVLFEKQSPDAQVNTPVCYDCHGVHDISSTDDPETGLEMQANLLERCQVCHPDATTNFPTAWMSHYVPSPEIYPLVYYVDLFYKFFIPITLGGMTLLVIMDAGRGMINRRRKHAVTTEEETGAAVFSGQAPSEDIADADSQDQYALQRQTAGRVAGSEQEEIDNASESDLQEESPQKNHPKDATDLNALQGDKSVSDEAEDQNG